MGVGIKTATAATILVFGIVGAQLHPEAVKISGRVFDQTGAPIANGIVLLRVAGSSLQVSSTRTDNDGTFAFTDTALNKYEVVFQVPGFKLSTVPVRPTESSIDLGNVVLEIGPIADPVESDVHITGPIMTTLCELAKSPGQFHGKIVQVHARVNPPGPDSGPSFVDKTCSAWVGLGTPTEPLERTYLNYLFERYMGLRRGFDVTFTGTFQLQLVLGESPAPYLRLQNVLDINAVQARPTLPLPPRRK